MNMLILKLPYLPVAVRAFQSEHVYISLQIKMKIIIELHRHTGKTETKALINSRAMENFIDHREVIWLHLGTKKLVKPLIGYNMDDTLNKHSHITDYVALLTKQGNHKKRMQFLISNLGENCLILGYPWLREFNPNLDWKQGKIIGLHIQIHTLNRAISLDMFQWPCWWHGHQTGTRWRTTLSNQLNDHCHGNGTQRL